MGEQNRLRCTKFTVKQCEQQICQYDNALGMNDVVDATVAIVLCHSRYLIMQFWHELSPDPFGFKTSATW